jgi:hypothetical protein
MTLVIAPLRASGEVPHNGIRWPPEQVSIEVGRQFFVGSSDRRLASKSDDAAPPRRRVSWYAKAGFGFGDRAASGEGSNSQWLAANRRAVTALQPAYGCYQIADDGAFSLDIPPPHPRMLDSSGRSLCGPPLLTDDGRPRPSC